MEASLLLLWFGLAVVTALAAGSRGRNGAVWFLLAALFPLLALIAVLVLPDLKVVRQQENATREIQRELAESKICPRCAERIRLSAKVCRFCNYEFTETELSAQQQQSVIGGLPGIRTAAEAVKRSNYRGYEYRVHKDGSVTARLSMGVFTWESASDFKTSIDKNL